MIESRVQKHLPNVWIAPIVGHHLRVNLDPKIVVSSVHQARACVAHIMRNCDHVLAQFLESLIEGVFVVFTFALTVGDEAHAVADEHKDTTVVYTIQGGHVGHTV